MGPVVEVVFASSKTVNWRAAIEELLDLVSNARDGNSIRVVTTRPIGGSYDAGDQASGRCFLIEMLESPHWETAALADEAVFPPFYEQEFGLRPDTSVTLSAMSNGVEDHRILGELALAVAERVGGVIGMGGLIVPGRIPVPVPGVTFPSWPSVRKGVQTFTAGMPGKAVAVPYLTVGGREWAAHAVDAAFLRAWLRHPDFHMIK
jgi:hypothetical protein